VRAGLTDSFESMDLTSLLAECEELLKEAASDQHSNSELGEYIPIVLTKKQKEFYDVSEKEALYSGSAGSGKSLALLAAALKYVDIPDYRALILRRNYPQLIQSGGLMDIANEWLTNTDAEYVANSRTWIFPSGARISFGHMQTENDKYQYQGGAWHFIGFDELTQFTQTQYLYLHSRLRGPNWLSIPFRIRAATNPGGTGHYWVKERFITPKKPSKDIVFVPAKLQDNPHLNQEEYLKSLDNLDPITKRQLRDGEWVANTQGIIYGCPDENLITALPELEEATYLLAIDLGASQVKATTAFVIIVWSAIIPDKVFVVESFARKALTVSDIADTIKGLNEQYPFDNIIMDQGALGLGYINEMQSRYFLPVTGVQKANKLGYRRILSSALSDTNVLIVEKTNKDLIKELRQLNWNQKGTDADPSQPDHLSDGLLYAFREATAFLSQKPPEKPPEPYTKQWYIEEEQRLEELDELDYEKSQTRWNQRRR
jgi:hypothetical protein